MVTSLIATVTVVDTFHTYWRTQAAGPVLGRKDQKSLGSRTSSGEIWVGEDNDQTEAQSGTYEETEAQNKRDQGAGWRTAKRSSQLCALGLW
jgi:hypothetical protein